MLAKYGSRMNFFGTQACFRYATCGWHLIQQSSMRLIILFITEVNLPLVLCGVRGPTGPGEKRVFKILWPSTMWCIYQLQTCANKWCEYDIPGYSSDKSCATVLFFFSSAVKVILLLQFDALVHLHAKCMQFSLLDFQLLGKLCGLGQFACNCWGSHCALFRCDLSLSAVIKLQYQWHLKKKKKKTFQKKPGEWKSEHA